MNKRSVCLFILSWVVLSACQKGRTRHTPSGMKYIAYRENHGVKPVAGDFVTFDMVYKTGNDSILFDSRKNQTPFRIQLEKIPFKGSLEEGLTCLSEGDSATFYISSDSLLKYVIRNAEDAGATLLKPGSSALFDIRLIRIQSHADALKEIAGKAAERQKAEVREIKEYLEREKYVSMPDSNGIYIVGNQGTKVIQDGDTVTVYYTGKYLNGIPFEMKSKPGSPLQFVMGAGQVIPGWEIAFKNLNEHSKVTLIIPSALAYGEKGLFNPSLGNYVVPPYTPLAYEVEIVSVKHP